MRFSLKKESTTSDRASKWMNNKPVPIYLLFLESIYECVSCSCRRRVWNIQRSILYISVGYMYVCMQVHVHIVFLSWWPTRETQKKVWVCLCLLWITSLSVHLHCLLQSSRLRFPWHCVKEVSTLILRPYVAVEADVQAMRGMKKKKKKDWLVWPKNCTQWQYTDKWKSG